MPRMTCFDWAIIDSFEGLLTIGTILGAAYVLDRRRRLHEDKIWKKVSEMDVEQTQRLGQGIRELAEDMRETSGSIRRVEQAADRRAKGDAGGGGGPE